MIAIACLWFVPHFLCYVNPEFRGDRFYGAMGGGGWSVVGGGDWGVVGVRGGWSVVGLRLCVRIS